MQNSKGLYTMQKHIKYTEQSTRYYISEIKQIFI